MYFIYSAQGYTQQHPFSSLLWLAVSWGVIRPPDDITVHEADEGPKTMSCLVVEECTDSPNPWFYQNGKQVTNDTTKRITVAHRPVAGTSTVVEWELQFAELKKEIFNSYTCRATPSEYTATLKKAGE